MNSVILRVGTRYLSGILLIFSVYLLIRGHNEPGGGFIGGLTGAIGFVLYAIAWGTKDAREALRILPQTIAMWGLLLALGAGIWAVLFGDAFFTGQWWFAGADPADPKDKGLPISSILVFDIGVYLVVLGSVLTIVFAMEEEV